MSKDINYHSLGKRKILLVEDMELNQYLARHIMESWGFEVTIATNGKQAVELVQRDTFDLVLMDIQMPEMDGVQATLQIRSSADPDVASLPIVALTANVSKSDSEKYLAAGMNGYLAKPFEEDKLFMIIAKNLQPQSNDPSPSNARESSLENAAAASEKLYDLLMIESIAGGDESFIKKMVQLFLDTMPETLQELQLQVTAQNWEALGKLAHKMKSTIDSMGISVLKDDIRSVEANSKNKQNLEQIEPLVAKVVSILEQCIAQIKGDFVL